MHGPTNVKLTVIFQAHRILTIQGFAFCNSAAKTSTV